MQAELPVTHPSDCYHASVNIMKRRAHLTLANESTFGRYDLTEHPSDQLSREEMCNCHCKLNVTDSYWHGLNGNLLTLQIGLKSISFVMPSLHKAANGLPFQ